MKTVDREVHTIPHEHFLDLDWRFSWEATQSILEFSHHHCKKGRICYLGCPTLALYEKEIGGGEVDWYLLDKGHYAIDKWVEGGLIDGSRHIEYNVVDALQKDLRASFDVIIMDPPWYEEYYNAFWQRAIGLVKPGGIIGVSEYPGYDPKKIDRFSDLRQKIVERIGGKDFFASIEISYSVPEFERFWNEHIKFTHAALDAYRPAYMDFYQIAKPQAKHSKTTSIVKKRFESVIELESGHYLRARKQIDWSQLSNTGVRMRTRTSLDRYKTDNKEIVAWSTNNTLVLISPNGKGIPVKNAEDLRKAVKKWESEQDHGPV